jgi:MarR family transcriptional regulator, organic hydroperoxide resistance regulator
MIKENDQDKKVYELMLALRRFTRSSLMLQHIIAGSIGLQVTEAECIDYLQEMGPSTAGALAKATRLTTGAITNVIDRLEKAGFVKRNPDPKDRRKVIVSFVPDNHKKAKLHYMALAADVENLFKSYNKQELELLLKHTEALDEIYKNNAFKIETGSNK